MNTHASKIKSEEVQVNGQDPPLNQSNHSKQQSFQRILLQGLGLGLWAAALYGSTQMHRVKLPGEHSICGPWGCAAEPSALLGYHLFLFALMAPIVVLGCRVARQPLGSQLARWMFLGGLMGAVGFVIWGAGGWIVEGRAGEYALQRGLFVLATTPDLPFLQLSLSGLLAMSYERVSKKNRFETDQKGKTTS